MTIASTAVATPAQRLEASRLNMQQVLKADTWPELVMARQAARQLAQHYPLATVLMVVAGVVVVASVKPWRWFQPSTAVKVAVAQSVCRMVGGAVLAAMQPRKPRQPGRTPQAGASKKA